VASVNPVDRDRGLRLVGVLTSVLAAASVVAVGATTALAADETRAQDARKIASASNAGDPGITVAEDTPTASPTATPKKRAKTPVSRKTRTTGPSDATRTKSQSADDEAPAAPKPATTKPKAKRTAAPATTVAEPPPVASTGS